MREVPPASPPIPAIGRELPMGAGTAEGSPMLPMGVDGVAGVFDALMAGTAELPLPWAQLPLGRPGLVDTFATSVPGSGKTRSTLSIVVHPFPIFALNTSGRADRSPPWPPLIPTTAQFMYISRLPTWLNQVQAKRALAADGAEAGILKSKVPPADVGHPPW